ncbi:MAG: glycosyltransferase family 2 protein, partial [Clostridiales bacterium]|nr:glycosyltransferase family 2 protein [Clostridiales bacterium]
MKNEEKNLPRSIRSVSRVVDEIIVVDTGSTDGTIAVAESLRAKVFHFEWINDFSAARNYAIQQATGDVIVFLDADEWFVPALSRRNRRVIEETFSYPEIDCITIKRTDVQEETGEVSSMDFTNLRIFRKDPSLLYMNSIHEFLRKKTAEGFGTPNTLPRPEWNINHSGYSANVFAEKASRNIEMLEAALEETNDTSTLFLYHSYLLREYNSAGQIEKAFTQLQYLMGRPEEIAAAARLFDKGFIGRIFIAMSVGYAFRDKI